MSTSSGVELISRKASATVLISCQHPMAREEITNNLRSTTSFDLVVSDYSNARPADTPPAMVVVDATEGDCAMDVVAEIRAALPDTPILAIVSSLRDAIVFPLLRLGAKGVLLYHDVPAELTRAATMVASGGFWISRTVLSRFVDAILPELKYVGRAESLPELSHREGEVLALLLDNLSNKEIACKLSVSERTIKFHVSHLLSKFGVGRRADLIVWWMQRSKFRPKVDPAV